MGAAVGPEGPEQVGKEGWKAVFSLLAPVSGDRGRITGQDGEMMGVSGAGAGGRSRQIEALRGQDQVCFLYHQLTLAAQESVWPVVGICD